MPIILDGTAGIDNNATDLSYTGTLTGGTGVVNLGSGQVYKDASGNVGIGTSSPATNLQVTNTSATTNATVTPVTVQAMTSGTAANGFGSSVEFNAEASDGASYAQTTISSIWTDATAATRSSALTFATRTSAGAITERMRIDSSGNFLVGTTTAVTTNVAGVMFAKVGTQGRMTIGSTSTSAQDIAYFFNPNGIVGSIQTNGSSTSYVTSSDYRLKHDIQPMTGALAKVAALKPVTYKWNADNSEDEGFIAHELQEVCPSAVTGEKDAVNEDGSIKPQGIDTSFLVATLTAAIQEQQAIIESLTARVVALEGQV